MNKKSFKHKLAAIFYADVAGYSRLTGEDEVGTHTRLSQYLDLMAEQIEQHQGRVVHYAGDAILADFNSVSASLRCADTIQQALASLNQGDSKVKLIIQKRTSIC